MFTYFRIVFFSLLVFLTGCKRELQIKKGKLEFEAQNFLHEAKFFDVPIFINSVPLQDGISESSYSYSTISDVSDLISFYDTEMENYGWRKHLEFNNFEKLLIYNKPNGRSVVISIRPILNSNKTNIFIFLNN